MLSCCDRKAFLNHMKALRMNPDSLLPGLALPLKIVHSECKCVKKRHQLWIKERALCSVWPDLFICTPQGWGELQPP